MTNTTSTRLSLASLENGESGILDSTTLSKEATLRLERLGLTPGRRIKLIKRGHRCLLAIAGARFALDLQLVSQLFITKPLDIS
ncbi:MAG: ferrous iron transport protein A [Bdellovibrionales bacterium]|nr:ferrous iron transport protein A [Bdellovibrionales bacterium]